MAMRRSWVAVLITATLFAGLHVSLTRRGGLTRSAVLNTAPADHFAAETVDAIDLHGIQPALHGRQDVTFVWRATWDVKTAALYALALESRGRTAWTIDGQLAHDIAGTEERLASRYVWLEAGLHEIEIRYSPAESPRIDVRASPVGDSLSLFSDAVLKPTPPRNPRIRQATVLARTALGWLLLLLTVLAVRKTSPTLTAVFRDRVAAQTRWMSLVKTARAPAAWLVLALILIYGALLRIDAITVRYGPVTSPVWLAAVQTRNLVPPHSIRPSWFPWVPAPLYPHRDGPPSQYRSDPYTYLTGARAMTHFYEPQWREPLYLYAVRTMLSVLDDQDVAVSFTSTLFAVLAIWFTYVLGAAVWSRPVGLAAALALAIDRDAAWFSSQGWRDDAFVAAVAAGAYLIIRCWRSVRKPPAVVRIGRFEIDRAYLDAAALGIAAGLIVLVRIMALSFLLAAAIALLVGVRAAWKRKAAVAGIAIALATLVAAPYFINCWRVFGDPFYTFNVHGDIYRVSEGQAETGTGTVSYVREKVTSRPFGTVETITRGLTVYPFSNKWEGLDAWRRGLGALVATWAIAGMVILAFVPAGRLLLFIGLTSLLPFSLTWKVDPNWRFTAHVYPFFLIAAAVTVSFAGRLFGGALSPSLRAVTPPWRRDDSSSAHRTNWLAGAAAVASASMVVWFALRISPQLAFAEALAFREDATVQATDDAFFDHGWIGKLDSGNVPLRVSLGQADLLLRLPEPGDYRVTFRLDPFPRPLSTSPERLPQLEYELNGTRLGALPLDWNPDRVGAYEVILPRDRVRSGTNRLVLRTQPRGGSSGHIAPGLTEGDAFGLWFLRVSKMQ